MNKFCKLLAVLVMPLFLAACPTNQDYFGTGPLEITPRINAAFERYKKAGMDALYMAVSEDGQHIGYSYCPAGQCGGGSSLMLAISACERRSGSKECRIYAQGHQVVWDRSKPAGDNPK